MYGWNLFLGDKFPKQEPKERESRRNTLGQELARRGVNPYYLTLEEFTRIFAASATAKTMIGRQEQQLNGCRNLLQRIPHTRSYRSPIAIEEEAVDV